MDRKRILAERMERLRSLCLAKDGSGSETYKNAKRMRLEYDPDYPGLAVVDAETGIGVVGRKFFGRIAAADELSADQTRLFNTWSEDRRRLFVLRHEVEHMSTSNRKMASIYRMGNIAVDNIPRHKLPYEVHASNKAFEWMQSL